MCVVEVTRCGGEVWRVGDGGECGGGVCDGGGVARVGDGGGNEVGVEVGCVRLGGGGGLKVRCMRLGVEVG